MIRQHFEVDYYNGTVLSKTEFITRAKNADALVIFMTDFIDVEIIENCPKLKVVASFGKGYDNIDVSSCTKRGILVTNNPDDLTASSADMAIALLLALCRNVVCSDAHIRAGEFRGWHPLNFLGSKEIANLQPGSYLINIGRGSTVDEDAVAEALRSEQLSGYAADVFEFEDQVISQGPDYINKKLLGCIGKTVFMSHLGTGTVDARQRLSVSTANQLICALKGEKPTGAINYMGIVGKITGGEPNCGGTDDNGCC